MLQWLGRHRHSVQVGAYLYAMFAGVALLMLGAVTGDWFSVVVGGLIAILGGGNLSGLVRRGRGDSDRPNEE